MVGRRVKPVVPRRTVRVGTNTRIPVQTTVTARPAVARRWLHTAIWRQRRRLRSRGGLTVGLGVQWTPAAAKGEAERPPGTLQLCAGGGHCLVFQIARAGGAVPRILRRLLADPRATFAAYYGGGDRRRLREHYGIEVAARPMLELRGAAGMGNASLAEMAAKLLEIFGVEEQKPMSVAMSEWDAPTLSDEQLQYAAVDAYISCRLGVYLRS